MLGVSGFVRRPHTSHTCTRVTDQYTYILVQCCDARKHARRKLEVMSTLIASAWVKGCCEKLILCLTSECWCSLQLLRLEGGCVTYLFESHNLRDTTSLYILSPNYRVTESTGGCNVCRRIWALLQIHARQCRRSNCPVSRCLLHVTRGTHLRQRKRT